jgi:hypothetical protein
LAIVESKRVPAAETRRPSKLDGAADRFNVNAVQRRGFRVVVLAAALAQLALASCGSSNTSPPSDLSPAAKASMSRLH